jgi:serine/threonine protein kinase/formylglycine-generating enzyme required for sulfatase activity
MPEDPKKTAFQERAGRTAGPSGAQPPVTSPGVPAGTTMPLASSTLVFGAEPSVGASSPDTAPLAPGDASPQWSQSGPGGDAAATLLESSALPARAAGARPVSGATWPNWPSPTDPSEAATLLAAADTMQPDRPASGPTTRARSTRETTSPLEQRIARARGREVTGDGAPSDKVEEKYEYRGIIGHGGMGKVILVKDRDLRRNVAMKLMRSGAASRPEFVARFLEEAQVTGQLEHPNIVPIHEVGLDDRDRVFFTMKHVKGVTLAEVFYKLAEGDEETVRHYTLVRLLSIIQQLANALSFAHARGVIHRDLKPDNVMLGEFGEVLMMDWGIAKLVGGERAPDSSVDSMPTASGELTHTVASVRSHSGVRTRVGSTLGTPGYMSPEQARGENASLDGRTDVFSLGAIMYHMLTGTPPYDQHTIEECLAATSQGLPVEPPAVRLRRVASKHELAIPREVTAITMKALSPDIAERYQSAEALAADIQRFLEGRSVLACPDTLAQRTVKWVKRNRMLVGASAAILCAVLVVGFGVSAYAHYSVIDRFTREAQGTLLSARSQRESALVQLSPNGAAPAGADPYAEQAAQRAAERIEDAYAKQLASAAESYLRVLNLAPSDAGARAALAETYFELWGTALRRNQPALMDEYARNVARYAGDVAYAARYRAAIDGDGRLALTANVEGAEVFLFRYVEIGKWGRLVPVPYRLEERRVDGEGLRQTTESLDARAEGWAPAARLGDDSSFGHRVGVTPLTLDPLPQGSYLLLVRAPGFEDLRLPVMLPRQKNLSIAADLVGTRARPEGFTYVPRVGAKVGGPSAGSKWQNHAWKTVEPFYIQTRELTFGEYEEFLEALLDAGRAEDARRHAPRDFGFTYLAIIGGELRPHESLTEGWRAWPVRGVSWLDAQAYIEWRSQRDGLQYRLPSELEWEVAARGADGRTYTWGEAFWPQAARLAHGSGYAMAPGAMSAPPSGGTTVDESPFGVWDLAGSQAEWCQDEFGDRAGEYAIRGNAWALQPVGLEAAFRTSGPPDYFHATIGFRLAADASGARE